MLGVCGGVMLVSRAASSRDDPVEVRAFWTADQRFGQSGGLCFTSSDTFMAWQRRIKDSLWLAKTATGLGTTIIHACV